MLVSIKRAAVLSLTSQLHLQDRACKCTFDFHLQVTWSLRRAIQVYLWLSLASHLTSQDMFTYSPLTFSHKSPRTCYPIAHPRMCYPSALLSSSHKPATADFVTLGTGLPLWHGYLFVVQWSCSCELDTATLPRVLYVERPLWAGFASDSICLDTVIVLLDMVALYSFLSVEQYLTLDTSTRCLTRSHFTLS